ncbi:Hypothetical predicted protein [Drosophila guanche]|uniref:Uncharacterized protein n=2 Tax=Drosophila guanche TaxID=7266 RepID=A0A3B0JR45_DROGU|nr:Hypothetical predicted protein [Drosophila guanche]
MIYVGRAEHEGHMMVCKVVPSKQIGFISNRGEALPKDIFELLCGQNLVWVKCYDHVIPETAVLCGRSSLDQPVYIGRGHYEGHLIIGKISSVHRALFIAFRGAERRLDSYEILVEERRVVPGWQLPPPPPPEELEKCPLTPPPPPSPPAPAPALALDPPVAEKKFSYPHLAAMPFPMSDRPPAYTPTPDPLPPPPVGGIFVMPPPTQAPPPGGVFVMPPVRPQPPPPPPPAPATPSFFPAVVAPAAIAVAPSFTPAETYRPPMGSYEAAGSSYTPAEYAPPAYELSSSSSYGYESNYDVWVTAGPGYFYSADAVIGGHDSNMEQLLVCRAYYAGVHVPGKAIPSQGCAYIAHGGREIVEPTYQVLLGQGKYHWVSAYGGSIAPGAVMAGRAPGGEPLYVGRAHYCGSLTPGVLQQSNRCLQIPFGGQEIRISSYEVLVRSDLYHSQQAMLLVY